MKLLWISALLLVGTMLLAVNADDDDVVITNANPEEPIADIVDDQYQSPSWDSLDSDLGRVHFADHFDNPEDSNARWIRSASKKAADSGADVEIAQYDGVWSVEAPQRALFRDDLGLVLKSQAKHAAIAARLVEPFRFKAGGRPLVVQYEVQLQDGQTCGGSYVKLLSEDSGIANKLEQFNDKTPYTIMFGPDKCGNDVKLHFIFRHVNPLTGAVEEKHCRKAKERLEEPFKDKQPHLYTLIVRPDNTYTIKVDHRVVNEGSLLVDFQPPVNPEREIDDASDSKPSDWDEREKIADPEARKPEDWDEAAPAQIIDASATKPVGWLDDVEELIADPAAVKPDDWDQEMDGEWEAPLIANEVCEKAIGCGLWKAPTIPNPEYKGKWHAPLIDNPLYRGKWAPRKIANPDWFEDLEPFRMKTISAVGFELWSMSGDILFDNVLITDNEELADQWAAQGYDLKRDKINTDAESFVTRVLKFANENPYMYAMFLVFVGLPLTFIMYFFCKSAPEQPYESNLSRNKKSDLNAGDDEQEELAAAAEDAANEDIGNETIANASPVDSKKKSGDNQSSAGYSLRNRKRTPVANDAEAEEVEDDAQPSEESDSAASNGEESATNNDSTEELTNAATKSKSVSPKGKIESVADNTRKRRQRKD